jgi:hypothetical protein
MKPVNSTLKKVSTKISIKMNRKKFSSSKCACSKMKKNASKNSYTCLKRKNVHTFLNTNESAMKSPPSSVASTAANPTLFFKTDTLSYQFLAKADSLKFIRPLTLRIVVKSLVKYITSMTVGVTR